ncbi:MAG: FxsA family protein [Austwickia sp.]|nr:FxsA family protein [Austwickia sp.]MBK8435273.1 FxsA family protein [Austwickia sp.]MBK9101175.1 FxsA family protein [Austwickia sp.]
MLMPLAELAVIIAIGRVIGGWETIALLLLESALGAWLVRRQGAGAWRALNLALQTGRMPARELSDAALVLVGGVLLLTPGFLTDLLGFFLLLPLTRPIARRWLQVIVERRMAQRIGIVRGQVI